MVFNAVNRGASCSIDNSKLLLFDPNALFFDCDHLEMCLRQSDDRGGVSSLAVDQSTDARTFCPPVDSHERVPHG
jgi:hypothetical protein